MKKKIKILTVVGTRPNFIKIAPLFEEFKKYKEIEPILVHTGQHYDFEMSKVFFQTLNITKPNYDLIVGSRLHGCQTAKAMEKIEPVILKEKPNLVIVVGDVNSTLAGALTAAKLHFPVVHVEAGLRSFDMSMPEEVNRLLTDHLSDYLFVTEPSGVKNLLAEGISKKKIYLVGNIMIDTLKKSEHNSKKSKVLKKLNLKKKNYAVLTLHRPENVDDKKIFKGILGAIEEIQKKTKIIWPIHPRAKKQLKKFKFLNKTRGMKNLILTKPLGYLELLSLNNQAGFVMTDSGGIQEETTALGVPCLTLRKTTERPITVEIGTNKVIGLNKEVIIKEAFKIIAGNAKKGKVPNYWDGKTAQRIVAILSKSIDYEK